MAAKDFSTRVLAWFDKHGRKDLPWQQDINAYRIWVSEIMLQQTQVATVIPYYQRFMQSFPDVQALARASADEVLHHWSGLGYYSRARNLHAAATIILHEHKGREPEDVQSWQALPGVGRSTAAAICSISFGSTDAILDGNVKRVLARHFAVLGWPGKTAVSGALWELAENCTPPSRNRDYTQAIMDLGATLCTRSKPRCEACPVASSCIAKQRDEVGLFPGRKPKKVVPVRETRMLLIENNAGELLLCKRPPAGIWGGLWALPDDNHGSQSYQDLALREIAQWPVMRHTFSHFHLDITPVHYKLKYDDAAQTIKEPNESIWYNLNSPPDIGLPAAISKLLGKFANDPKNQNA